MFNKLKRIFRFLFFQWKFNLKDYDEFRDALYSPGSDKICEHCCYYKRIDSGYGFCTRFPPAYVPELKDWRYPVVAWYLKSCGEFKKKQVKKRNTSQN